MVGKMARMGTGMIDIVKEKEQPIKPVNLIQKSKKRSGTKFISNEEKEDEDLSII
jgi:hypothetical protein